MVKTPTTRSFSSTTAEPYLCSAISEATLLKEERGLTVYGTGVIASLTSTSPGSTPRSVSMRCRSRCETMPTSFPDSRTGRCRIPCSLMSRWAAASVW